MKLSAFLSLLALVLQEAGTTSLPGKERKRREDQKHKDHSSRTALRLENYVPSLDSYDEVIDLSHHEPTDHRDQLPEVRGTQQTSCIPSKKLGARGLAPLPCSMMQVSQACNSFSRRWKFLSLHSNLLLR